MEVVRPQAERVLADEGALDQPHRGCLVARARGQGRQSQIEAVGQRDRAQDVPFVGGEVAERAGDQGGEVVVEVGRAQARPVPTASAET
ncbi:hypothetical protein [Streptomyces sp. NPDC002133]|uniref:hypothetical protein n=1 Tax=Streptomyces sp. NPDC002133 TaxID=3154409 RepID=UPI003319D067